MGLTLYVIHPIEWINNVLVVIYARVKISKLQHTSRQRVWFHSIWSILWKADLYLRRFMLPYRLSSLSTRCASLTLKRCLRKNIPHNINCKDQLNFREARAEAFLSSLRQLVDKLCLNRTIWQLLVRLLEIQNVTRRFIYHMIQFMRRNMKYLGFDRAVAHDRRILNLFSSNECTVVCTDTYTKMRMRSINIWIAAMT